MKIKILLVMPDEEVKVKKISGNYKAIKSLIGNEIIEMELDKDILLIANQHPKASDFNRILGEHIIRGAFVIVYRSNNKLVSLKKRNIRKYRNMFKLKKHRKKIEHIKEEYLEDYYYNKPNSNQNRRLVSEASESVCFQNKRMMKLIA